jgi:energy-coupling factor transport system ATP-binding protein
MEIIFRFIPLLIDEAVAIIKTQSIRGGLGKEKGKMAKIRALVPLIVPLIIQTIKRSESLADAITMRCFK